MILKEYLEENLNINLKDNLPEILTAVNAYKAISKKHKFIENQIKVCEISCYVKLLINKHQDVISLGVIRNSYVTDLINSKKFFGINLNKLKLKLFEKTDIYLDSIRNHNTSNLDKYEKILFDYYFLFK